MMGRTASRVSVPGHRPASLETSHFRAWKLEAACRKFPEGVQNFPMFCGPISGFGLSTMIYAVVFCCCFVLLWFFSFSDVAQICHERRLGLINQQLRKLSLFSLRKVFGAFQKLPGSSFDERSMNDDRFLKYTLGF